MSENFHFGQPSNGLICSCGKHYGVGEWSPERRAAVYARMRDRLPFLITDPRKFYLEDFERLHGTVQYTMSVVGSNPGNIRKEDKGKQVMGPIFNFNYDMGRKKA